MAHPLVNRGSEHGLVLMSSLAILLGLMLVGLGVGTMLQNDFRTSGNLRESTEALYFSAAGIEWSKAQIARSGEFPPAVPNQQVPFSSGAFTVAAQPVSIAGPLSARLALRSIGSSRSASQLIEAQVTKTYDLADAAIVLRGNGASVNLGETDIFISGAEHDETGARMTAGSPRTAISTDDAALHALLAEAIADRPNAVDQTAGVGPLSQSSYLSSAFISQFANALCATSTALKHVVPGAGQLVIENQIWGARSAPQLRCIEGSADVEDEVVLSGNFSGAGILVVQDAKLRLSGPFRWEGLVVVTGSDISFETSGADAKLIAGAAIVNESGIPGAGRRIVAFDGAVRIGFSRRTLAETVHLLPSSILPLAYEALPSIIVQNYWRADPR